MQHAKPCHATYHANSRFGYKAPLWMLNSVSIAFENWCNLLYVLSTLSISAHLFKINNVLMSWLSTEPLVCNILAYPLKYVGTIWFVIHVLSLLPIRFTQQNSGCINDETSTKTG